MSTAAAPSRAPAESADAFHLRNLPKAGREKYERLRRAAQRARAVIDGLQNEIDRVREARASAMRDLDIHDKRFPAQYVWEAEGKARKRVTAPDPQRDVLAAAVAEATGELVKLQEDQRAVIVPNIEALDGWLRSHSGARFVPAFAPAPKIGRNETLAAALERLADDQRRISDELASVQNAPRTVAEAKAAMRSQIEALAARGRPEVSGLFSGEPVKWPALQLVASGHGAHEYVSFVEAADALGLFAWMHKEALIGALDKEIEVLGAHDTDALSADDQAARVIALTAQLTTLKRQAEQLHDRLEADGITITCRDYSDPAIILGVERP